MPLVSENSLLRDAEERKYAVPGLFPFDLDFIKIIIEAAEEEESPVIIIQGPEFIQDYGPEIISPAVISAANHAKVPVCVSADHTFKTDDTTLDYLMMCLHYGWKSIMFDGSLLPYEENVRRTKEISKICHAAGVACVGALGEVKRFFPGVKDETEYYYDEFIVPEEIMTDPDQAKRFVEETQVDSLAISIGQYVRSLWEKETLPIDRTARLDFERLSEIRKKTDAHLILHGSTYVAEEDLRKSTEYGISEIKAATEYGIVWSTYVRKTLDEDANLMFPIDIQKPALAKVKETMVSYMRLFKSSGKASDFIWR